MTGTVELPAPVTKPGSRDLSALFAPRGVAVIGASRDPAKLGSAMSRSLAGFSGRVVGINPRDADEAAGRYGSVRDAVDATGGPIDLAILCVPAPVSAAAIEDAASAGVRAALVCAGGFAEIGDDGIRHQRDLVAAARAADVALLGPNTSGFIVPARGLSASFVPGVTVLRPGPVAVVAASGGVNHALAFQFDRGGSGVSLAVGIGNGADITAADVLQHLGNDPTTTVIALHVESVPDGPALVDAIRQVTARKPVVALVVGRNEVSEFARSHTGALATSWRTTRAALAAAGAVLVDDERELVDAATALSFGRLPTADTIGVGVVTAQAGPGLLHIDGLRGAGIEVPALADTTVERLAGLLPPLTFQRNPVDTGRPGPTFADVLRVVAADPAVGITSVYALTEPDVVDLPSAVAAAGAGPFVVGLDGPDADVRRQRDTLREHGVAAVIGPTALTHAVRALVADARARATMSQPATRLAAPLQLDAAPDEDVAKTILSGLGITTPPRRVCTDRADAHRALAELPSPVAVKILDAAVTHKTDVGGVHLAVRTTADLDAALDALERIGAERVLIETMAPSGVDLIVGATRDPVFGAQVLVGLGGTVAEALEDVAVAPAPLSGDAAATLLDQLAGRALLDGFRGGPVVDRARVGNVLATLGDLIADSPNIEAVEINPLRATRDDLLALDAVITLLDAPSEALDEGGQS
jgi:acyl-CoA synthetase (NDP forming)